MTDPTMLKTSDQTPKRAIPKGFTSLLAARGPALSSVGRRTVLLAMFTFLSFRGEARGESTTSTITVLPPHEARLVEAVQALAAGDAARVDRILSLSTAPLDDYRALLRGRALLLLGKKDHAYRELETVKARAMRCGKQKGALDLAHPLYVEATRVKADVLADSEPIAAAELLLALPAAGDLLASAIELSRRAGDTAQAEAAEARLLVEVPESPEGRALAKSLTAQGIKDRLPNDAQRMQRVRNLLDAHQNAEARQEAMRLREELGEKSDLICELLFIAGKADRKLRQYASAIKTLVEAKERCIKDEETEMSLRAALLEVQVRSIRGQAQAAKKVAEWIAKAHPESTLGDDALLHVANLFHDSGNAAAAKKLYLKIIDEIPNNDQGAEASWRLAYAAIKANDFNEASKRLSAVLERPDTPAIERARARYWLATITLPKDEAKARVLFNELVMQPSFYAWLALDRLELSKPAWAKEMRAGLVKIRDGGLTFASSNLVSPELERARSFRRLGLSDYAEAEMEQSVACMETDEQALSLALALDELGAHGRAQLILRGRPQMFAGPLTPERVGLLRAAYSRPYLDLVEKAAKESKIEPLFFIALVREESTFDPEIVSWAGATGLAQLMPGTAIVAHLALKLGKLDQERLIEPELNLRLGARVLSDAMRDFKQREPIALVAYNGGPGVAKKVTEVSPPKPFDRWVEEISIKETRGYVKRVMETYGIYRFLYDQQKPFIGLPDDIGN
jgi:soluble lytic murein transglycosylase